MVQARRAPANPLVGSFRRWHIRLCWGGRSFDVLADQGHPGFEPHVLEPQPLIRRRPNAAPDGAACARPGAIGWQGSCGRSKIYNGCSECYAFRDLGRSLRESRGAWSGRARWSGPRKGERVACLDVSMPLLLWSPPLICPDGGGALQGHRAWSSTGQYCARVAEGRLGRETGLLPVSRRTVPSPGHFSSLLSRGSRPAA